MGNGQADCGIDYFESMSSTDSSTVSSEIHESVNHLLATTRFQLVRVREWHGCAGWKLGGRQEPTVFFLWLKEGRIRWRLRDNTPQWMCAGDLLIAPEQVFVDGWTTRHESAPQIAGRLTARVLGGCDVCACLGIEGAYTGTARITDLIRRMLHEYEARPLGWQVRADSAVAELIIHLLRSHSAPPDIRGLGMTHFRRLTPAMALLDERYSDTSLRIADLAAAVSLSEVAFRQLCRRALNKKPAELLRHRRTEAAAHLLATTDLPIKAVSERCGFGDPAFFCRSFRKTTGLTPGRYRKQGLPEG